MLRLLGNFLGRTCDGVSRRTFLQAGTLGLGGLTLADLLRLKSGEPSAPKRAQSGHHGLPSAGPATSTCTT